MFLKNEEEEEEEKIPDSYENNAINVSKRTKNIQRYSFENVEMKNFKNSR